MRAVLAATGLFTLGGCFSPSFGEGQFSCGPEGGCPPGFECHAGQCVSGPPAFDAGAPGSDAAADAGPSLPDATPAAPSRWYQYDDEAGVWTSSSASSLFRGAGAPAAGDVQAAWSHCGGFGELFCFGTATGWTCTDDDGASFFGNDWSAIDARLAANPPTHITHFFDGFTGTDAREVMFASAEKWWLLRYVERPLKLLGGVWMPAVVSDWTTLGAFDELWSSDDNAPDDPAAIVAAFTGFEAERRWKLWSADGTEYSYRRPDAFEPPGPSPLLARPGSPPPQLVVAATRCRDQLYVLTRATN